MVLLHLQNKSGLGVDSLDLWFVDATDSCLHLQKKPGLGDDCCLHLQNTTGLGVDSLDLWHGDDERWIYKVQMLLCSQIHYSQ